MSFILNLKPDNFNNIIFIYCISKNQGNTEKRFKKQEIKYLPEWLLLGFSKVKHLGS